MALCCCLGRQRKQPAENCDELQAINPPQRESNAESGNETTASDQHKSKNPEDDQNPTPVGDTTGGNSTSSAVPQSKPINLWYQAYSRCYEDKDGKKGKLLDELKDILVPQKSPSEGVDVGEDTREKVDLGEDTKKKEFETLSSTLKLDLLGKVKTLEEHKWKIPLMNGELEFGTVVEKCVDVVVLAKDFVGGALSSNPYASLAWSAVCIGIQFVKNPIQGQRNLLDAFHSISKIINYFAVVETLPEIAAPQSNLKDAAIELYCRILTFQAEALKHLTRHTVRRAWSDTIDPNHWRKLLQEIKDQEGSCDKTLNRDSRLALANQSRDIGGLREELRESVKNQMDAFKNLESLISVVMDEHAFSNLLKRCADGAAQGSDKPRCLADTRLRIRSDIISWATSNNLNNERVFWITGVAGAGKSTIAGTIADHCKEQGQVVVSFFFSREMLGRGNTEHLVPTIARQLMDSSKILKHYICEALIQYHGHFDYPADKQWNSLVKDPLGKLAEATGDSLAPPTIIIIIDALDECGEDVINHVTSLLSGLKDINSVCFRALVTSRDTKPIRSEMTKKLPTCRKLDLFTDVKPTEINSDIRSYYEYKLRTIKKEFCNNNNGGLWDTGKDNSQALDKWPTEEVLSLLVEKTNGLFQYARVACNIIQGNNSDISPAERAQDVLDSDISGNLDKLYSKALELSVPGGPGATDNDRTRFFEKFQLIVGAILFLPEPLSGEGIANLLGKDSDVDIHAVGSLLGSLRSVLYVPSKPSQAIKAIHLSLRELLSNEKRCKDCEIPKFHVNENDVHRRLFRGCTKVLASCVPPKYDIDRTMIRIFLEENYDARSIPPEVRYASLFWTTHWRKANPIPTEEFVKLATRLAERHGKVWITILCFLGEPEGGRKSAIIFEDMIDYIKGSFRNDFTDDQLRLLEDIPRCIFEDLQS